MRVFIAIDINEQIRSSISALQDELKKEADINRGQAKWVRPSNIHLTLKFLGEVLDQQLIDICKIVESVTRKYNKFNLSIESLGYFGGRSARVSWIGVGQGKEELLKLQKELEEEIQKVGWAKEERAFTGHLTVCRIKNTRAGKQIAEVSANYKDFNAGSVLVDSVKVYQSQLTPKGPIYSVLGSYSLH
ncbi:MAG: RNA 2',3'-cyclic phosphodiesterase [Planctomycetota bacterium]|jgi:2'-5' RNA ligase